MILAEDHDLGRQACSCWNNMILVGNKEPPFPDHLRTTSLPFSAKFQNEFPSVSGPVWGQSLPVGSSHTQWKKDKKTHSYNRVQTIEIRVQTTEIRVQTTEIRVQTTAIRVQTTEIRVQTTEIRLQTEIRVQTTEIRVQTTEISPKNPYTSPKYPYRGRPSASRGPQGWPPRTFNIKVHQKRQFFWRSPPSSELPERGKKRAVFLEVSAELGTPRTCKIH